jgi:hypothetical protein
MNKTKSVRGILGLIVLISQASAQATADEIAQNRTEQILPRSAIPFDPAMFDKYVGYYQMGPRVILVIDTIGFKKGPYSMVDYAFFQSLACGGAFRLINYEAAQAAEARHDKDGYDMRSRRRPLST